MNSAIPSAPFAGVQHFDFLIGSTEIILAAELAVGFIDERWTYVANRSA